MSTEHSGAWHDGMVLITHPDGVECWHRERRKVADRRAAASSTEPEGLLGGLDEDDVMYDYPVAMSGEPMDPVLFVRWDAVRAALTEVPVIPDELDRDRFRRAVAHAWPKHWEGTRSMPPSDFDRDWLVDDPALPSDALADAIADAYEGKPTGALRLSEPPQ